MIGRRCRFSKRVTAGLPAEVHRPDCPCRTVSGRRSATGAAEETGQHREVMEAMLAHVVLNRVQAPIGARIRSSADADSWRTGPPTWPARAETWGPGRAVDAPSAQRRPTAFPVSRARNASRDVTDRVASFGSSADPFAHGPYARSCRRCGRTRMRGTRRQYAIPRPRALHRAPISSHAHAE